MSSIYPRNIYERFAQGEAALRIESLIGVRELGYDPIERRRAEERHMEHLRQLYADQNDRSANNKSRRRARHYGCDSERYSRQAVIKRDDGICHICGTRPDRIHIDHLIPLSIGGPDTMDNVAVACATCNVSRNVSPLPTNSRYYHVRPSGQPWYDSGRGPA